VGHGSVRLPLAGLIAAALLATCAAPVAEPVPSELEARAFLDEVVTLASAGQFEEMCALGASSCARILEDAASPPPGDPPTVVGIRAIQPDTTGDVRSSGGLVLELCGDIQGETYYTEMLVFRENGELRAIEPVYWSGFRVAQDGTVGTPGPDADALCAPSP
jgi:hypothetical protein